MNTRSIIERKISRLNNSIDEMERNNDGSLQWVDDIRALYLDLFEAELELVELNCTYKGG